MRRLLISALFLIASTAALAAPAVDNSLVLGVWKAQTDSLPLMTLTVEQQNGQLIGAVLFYLIRRNPGAPETSSAGVPEPLIDPTFDGKTLAFKVSHSHAHTDSEHTPPVAFHFELTGSGKLRALGPEGKPIELARDTSF
jgi:hypothetical protein